MGVTMLKCAAPAAMTPRRRLGRLGANANGQDFSADEVLFEYQQAAQLDDVAPSRGASSGGPFVGVGFSRCSAMLGHSYARFKMSKVPPTVAVSARRGGAAWCPSTPPGW